ncbi:hypothetical protein [Paenibacillus sp. V4I7]|nr:hypothetical protein [Paenibacillus sp. V4I7]MDQ0898439.1 hypothetical protein [Paenibacillus sp. V4I7]
MTAFDHITDSYFKDKLLRGLIEYKPEDWVVLEELDENTKPKYGGKK